MKLCIYCKKKMETEGKGEHSCTECLASFDEQDGVWTLPEEVKCYFCHSIGNRSNGEPAYEYNNYDGGWVCPDCLQMKAMKKIKPEYLFNPNEETP